MKELNRKIRIAIVLDENDADAHGLVIKTFFESELAEMFTPVVYGSLTLLKQESSRLQIRYNAQIVGNASQADPDALNFVDTTGRSAVEIAKKEFEADLLDAFIVVPMSREVVNQLRNAVIPNPVVKRQENDTKAVPLMCTNQLHVAYVVTDKGDIAGVTTESIENKARILHSTLRRDLRQDNPRVAVLSYNPEIVADEKSIEIQVIAPAISKLVNTGIPVFGPYTYADFFESGKHLDFDAVLTMTREQAQAPFLSMYDGNGITLAAGIAPVVVSPVKLDGDNNATEDSFREAIYMAIDVYRSRFFFDLPYVNPLPKMYHERREDGEKARFAVKKRFSDGEQKDGERQEGHKHSEHKHAEEKPAENKAAENKTAENKEENKEA